MKRRLCGSAMALGLCALAAGVMPGQASAQAPRPIQVGQQLQGTLTQNDPRANDRGAFQVYRFDGRQGQHLLVRMNSSDVDSYLAVGRTVAGITDFLKSDDDSGGDTNARIRFTVPRNGEYLIVTQSLDSTRTGGYTLLLDTLPTPVVKPPVLVRAGQTLGGALEEGDPVVSDAEEAFYDLYTLTATAGQRVQVDMRAADFDAFLEIGRMQGGEMEVLRSNDDAPAGAAGEGSLDSRLIFTAPTAGQYTLRARSLGAGSIGIYTLAVTQLPPVRVPAPSPVTLGQTVQGSLSTDDPVNDDEVHYDAYVVRGRPGETLEITMASEAFDTFVAFGRMQGGGFEQIDSNDDGEDGTNSLLRVTLDRAGEYVVRAQSLSPGQTGAYTLTVRAAAR